MLLQTAITIVFALCFFQTTKCVRGQLEQMPPDIGTCQSEYQEQPPDQLACNPYVNAELKLECTVRLLLEEEGSLLSEGMTIDWFYGPLLLPGTPKTESKLAMNRLDNMQENITIREEMVISGSSMHKRSHMELRGLDEFDVGRYWCGIRIDSAELMILSDPVPLQLPSRYTGFEACSATVPQSKQEVKCATWIFGTSTSPHINTTPPPPTITASVETAPADGEDSDDEGPVMVFYIAVAILIAFGVIITGLVSAVVAMCIKYRTTMKRKREQADAEDRSPRVIVQSPSTIATDYLVPLTLMEQQQSQVQSLSMRADNPVYMSDPLRADNPVYMTSDSLRADPLRADNPVYMSDLRRVFTSLWLQRQPRTRSAVFEHSYETMTHDYEDIFMESMNGGTANPVLMKKNEAYTIPRTVHGLPHIVPL